MIEIEAPNVARYGTRTVKVGPAVWLALRALLAADGVVSFSDLSSCVYGHLVCRNTVSALVSRANRKLIGLGVGVSISVHGETVTLN